MTLFKTLSLLFLCAIISTSCSSNANETTTFWVNSMKVDCDAGAGKAQCLQIYKGDDLEHAKWTYFYSPIEGFTFEPGLLKKIEVSETHLDPKDVPADASSIKYTLVKVLEEMLDPRMHLHDIWAATHINGNTLNKENTFIPTLEINISRMAIMGTDGCNNYTGNIKSLGDKNITFGPIAGTRKMCPNMETPDAFNKALNHSASFKRDGLKLYLFDANGKETLRFNKID
ncbi:DUF4377 domain-containing protein [Pseudotamlana haliotis]|nr:DUF4377 domain-containing protein [Tamlana haliotis]